MARNPRLPLTEAQMRTVGIFSLKLWEAHQTGATVTLHYIKRNGDASSSTGTIVDILGQDSTLAVIVDTADKGPRTVNIWGITDITD